MPSAVDAVSAHEAYVERVKAEYYGPRYDWFLELLSAPWVGATVETSCLYILDFEGNTAPKVVLRTAAADDVQAGVFSALGLGTSSAATRVVLLCYSALYFLNKEYIGVIGHALGVDPQFFMTHFRDRQDELSHTSKPLPSLSHLDTSILQFYLLNGFMTVCIVQDVVVILYEVEHFGPSLPLINEVTKPLLTRSSYLQDQNAPQSYPPIDLVALILQVPTLDLVTKVDHDELPIRKKRMPPPTGPMPTKIETWDSGRWESYWNDRIRTEATMRSLRSALKSEKWSKGHALLATKLLQEYTIILDRLQSQGECIREGVQQVYATASIHEARKGIQLSDSVRRLTLVALVFIPLNFATSFFGMNIHQLGSGSINIGYFFLTAALTSGLATFLSFAIKPLDSRLQRKRRELASSLGEDANNVQKREILRQSRLGHKVWNRGPRVVHSFIPDTFTDEKFFHAGPKIRKAMKLSAGAHWDKLTTRFRGSHKGQQADPEQPPVDTARTG